jgi:dynein heavy chain
MQLVWFIDCCEHIARVSRVLNQPSGNALLLGVGGSGRQSCARLATFIANFKVYQIEIVKGYGMTHWRENLRECLMLAGIEMQPTNFLFVDT